MVLLACPARTPLSTLRYQDITAPAERFGVRDPPQACAFDTATVIGATGAARCAADLVAQRKLGLLSLGCDWDHCHRRIDLAADGPL